VAQTFLSVSEELNAQAGFEAVGRQSAMPVPPKNADVDVGAPGFFALLSVLGG